MKTRRQSSLSCGRIVRLAMSALLIACSSQAHSALRVGDSTAEGVAAGNTPELMLVIWDTVKEISYTKDLGVSVYKENYASGSTSTNLYVYGQQETLYQQLTTLNSDANFQTFLNTSTNANNQIWAVIAVSSDPSSPMSEGSNSIFTTLKASTSTGTLNPQYTALVEWTNTAMADAEGSLHSNLQKLSNGSGCSGSCATDYEANNSTVATKIQAGYAGVAFKSGGGLLTADSKTINVFNSVNQSSWFYALTTTSDVAENTISVDEFDNLAHDAYWGLGVDSNGNYILSYTLEASMTQAQTVAGSLLRLRTDFAANYGSTRLIDAPEGDTLDLGGDNNVTAVPEPATWGLMGLGLAVLAGRARRRSA
jgi:hypothetical protein